MYPYLFWQTCAPNHSILAVPGDMFYSLHSSLFAGYGTCVISEAHVTTGRVIESRKHSVPTIHKSLVCQSGMLTSILKVLVVELSGFWFR